MTPLVSIIIPTWNNPEYLNPCINSIIRTGALNGFCELIIINNGGQPIEDFVRGAHGIKIIKPGRNLGWERGLDLGIKNSTAPFLCFQNDDTFIPYANSNFYNQLLVPFRDKNVAAVGPATTNAAGWHSIYLGDPLRNITNVGFLIFFTAMVRRSILEEVGGIDLDCPGGDDLDLSIRFRKAGKKILINPNAFIIHHAFKTGNRVRGDSSAVDGWNSREMTDATNKWLINKHGFKSFFTMLTSEKSDYGFINVDDKEGDVIRFYTQGDDIVELACGSNKTIPDSIGVDRVPKGEQIPHLGTKSVADVVADVSDNLPFPTNSVGTIIARHVLEHMVDPVHAIKAWRKSLKVGGKLIIAVPDENIGKTIPMNPEHVHAFTQESLTNLMELCGFKHINSVDTENGVSFVGIYKKTQDNRVEEVHARD